MGTRFRAMLAPIGVSTGDGRRFAPGSITAAPTPFPFEWARERDTGHDGAVTIGAVHSVEITNDAVWAEGEFFDDVDREEMPRLAEDVAEAMKLVSEGVLGPSVDLDEFQGVPVREGTDIELEPDDWDDPDLKVELLITEGRIRAATLVSIPAYVETVRPLTLLDPDEDEFATRVSAKLAEETGGEFEPTEPAPQITAEQRAALVASVALPDPSAFDRPELDGPTPVTVDWETGRIFGHIATWGTCHAGFPDVCITPPKNPREDGEYSWFHRFPVDTSEGVVWAGRLTAGGRHPGLNLSASATMSAYDGKTVAAYVRAGEDDHGIWISGVVNPDLDERTKRILSRRKVSGDWRETSDGLSLVELLALSPGPRLHSEPGFPVATHSRNGRQVALTAALGPSPDDEPRRELFAQISAEVAAQLRAERAAEEERQARRAELAAALEADRNNRAAPVRAELAEMLEG